MNLYQIAPHTTPTTKPIMIDIENELAILESITCIPLWAGENNIIWMKTRLTIITRISVIIDSIFKIKVTSFLRFLKPSAKETTIGELVPPTIAPKRSDNNGEKLKKISAICKSGLQMNFRRCIVVFAGLLGRWRTRGFWLSYNLRAYPNNPLSFVILRRKKACPERSRRAEESGQRREDSSLRYAEPVLERSEGFRMTGESE